MSNELVKIVAESGLETTKAEFILKQFEGYFAMAADWEKKAKAIVVTSEDQTAEMKMAREGRLFLREKRISIEKRRKELKEESLREGKAIDGIANVLKGLIVPVEEYLDEQEKYAINKAAERAEAKRIAEEQAAKEKGEQEERERIERERVEAEKRATEEKRRAAESERIEKENKKLKVDATKKEEEARKKERKHQAELEKEREARDKLAREKGAALEKAQREKQKATEMKKILNNTISCPKCGHCFVVERTRYEK